MALAITQESDTVKLFVNFKLVINGKIKDIF